MNTYKPMPPLESLQEFYKIDPESPSGLSRTKRTQGPNGNIGPVLSVGGDGYWRLSFRGECYATHRVIYFMATGQDPGALVVDHIDGDHLNNHAANLRACTQQQNLYNARGKPKRSGLPKGIDQLPNGRFRVYVSIEGVRHVSTLENLNAAKCYLRSVRERNHGEYARA